MTLLQLADKKTCPDLVCEDTFQLPNDVSAGYLTKLDDYVKDYEDWNTSYYESMKKGVTGADGSVYGMDIIPSDLATYGGEAKNLLRDLQSRNERMFLLTLLVLNVADTKQKLDNDVFQAASIAQKYNCMLTRLDYRQEQGLMSIS